MHVPKQARYGNVRTLKMIVLFAESEQESDDSESEEPKKKKKKKITSKAKLRKGKKEGMYRSGNVCSQASEIKRD